MSRKSYFPRRLSNPTGSSRLRTNYTTSTATSGGNSQYSNTNSDAYCESYRRCWDNEFNQRLAAKEIASLKQQNKDLKTRVANIERIFVLEAEAQDPHFPNFSDKNIFEEWFGHRCDTTTLHGPPHAVAARKWLRRFWIMLIFICAGIATYQVATLALIYTRNDENWRTTVYEKSQNGLRMPDITFCSFNRISYRKAKAFGMTHQLIMEFLTYFNDTYPFLLPGYLQNRTHLKEFLDDRNLTVFSILNEISPDCSETVFTLQSGLDLTHNGTLDLMNNSHICNAKLSDGDPFEIRPDYSRTMGKCFKLIINPNVTVAEPGYKYGVSMFLDAQTEDYIPDVLNNYVDFGFTFDLDYGTKITGGRITVSPGFHTWIGMQVTQGKVRDSSDWFSIDNPPGCLIQGHLKVLKSW